jgi:hypothetical protein
LGLGLTTYPGKIYCYETMEEARNPHRVIAPVKKKEDTEEISVFPIPSNLLTF